MSLENSSRADRPLGRLLLLGLRHGPNDLLTDRQTDSPHLDASHLEKRHKEPRPVPGEGAYRRVEP